jgi:predicted nucleotidyltransferase
MASQRAMASEEIESRLREFFSESSRDIVAVYLFGSQARGTATPSSDVDVAVLHAAPPPVSLEGLPFDLEGQLERLLGRSVQVVVLNRASVDLIHRVLRDGRLLLDRDASRRIGFEVRARDEFFDLQPVLARYRAGRTAAS